MSTRKALFVANWKMNHGLTEATDFALKFQASIKTLGDVEVAVAPQLCHVGWFSERVQGSRIYLAAQNAGPKASGALTGEVSPVALRELGVRFVILGHSERRWVFHEQEALIAERFAAVVEAGLSPLLCVGERLADRKEGRTFSIVESQLEVLRGRIAQCPELVVAYEPVWAIGTGETASPEQAQEVHTFIRKWLNEKLGAQWGQTTRILYGGSVKASNSKELMAQSEVDGLLVGGASLDPLGFAELIRNGVSSQA